MPIKSPDGCQVSMMNETIVHRRGQIKRYLFRSHCIQIVLNGTELDHQESDFSWRECLGIFFFLGQGEAGSKTTRKIASLEQVAIETGWS